MFLKMANAAQFATILVPSLNDRYLAWLATCHARFNHKFDYSLVNYQRANDPIVVACPLHGEFYTTPFRHSSSKHGCPKCGDIAMGLKQREASREKFWEGVTKHHNGYYDYSRTSFEFITDRIQVVCPEHGSFELTADHHMRGVSCSLCANKNKKGGYTEAWFSADEARKSIPGILYLVEMSNSDEHFLKIGMTRNTVKGRYAGCPYSFSILSERSMDLYAVFKAEEAIKSLKDNRYYPKLGIYKTESFRLGAKEMILERMKNK